MSLAVPCQWTSGTSVTCDGFHFNANHVTLSTSDGILWTHVFLCCLLLSLSALFSGLTIGILSLDVLSLRVITATGPTESERWAARRILPLVQRHHYVLVTLVASNAACNEALPIVMDKIFTSIVTLMLSITVITLIGELLPQAICVRHGLVIGAYLYPAVVLLMIVWFPVAYPMSLFLDWLLGREGHRAYHNRRMLKALFAIHGPKERKLRSSSKVNMSKASTASRVQQGDSEDIQEQKGFFAFVSACSAHGIDSAEEIDIRPQLCEGEVKMIHGALSLKEKTAMDAMIPLEKIFMLSMDLLLDKKTLELISCKKFSRIPVYDKDREDIRKILLVKSLLTWTFSAGQQTKIRSLPKNYLVEADYVAATTSLYDLLNHFQTGITHLSVVIGGLDEDGHPDPKVLGIVCMEDIVEEILQKEIYDEMDFYKYTNAGRSSSCIKVSCDVDNRISLMSADDLHGSHEELKESS